MRYLFPLLSLLVVALANTTTTTPPAADDGDLLLADRPSVLKTDPIEFQLNFNSDAPKGADAAAEISQQGIYVSFLHCESQTSASRILHTDTIVEKQIQ